MDKYTKLIENNEIINKIKPYITDKEVYIVGGFIRDILLFEEESPDIDLIVCSSELELFTKDLADKLNAYFIELDPINSIYRLVLEDKIHYIDITKPINNNLEQDVKRRDLTINAILYDINNKNFIDLTGGIKDIEEGVIRGISYDNFNDDPLRLLRIFRFHAKTGFDIEEKLILTAKELHNKINEPAKERINTELLKMFEGKYTDSALLKMDECGLLEEIFPIFKEVKKIPPNSHHHLDLFRHSVETVKQIQNIYETQPENIKSHLDTYKLGGIKLIAFLKSAGFMHDIGKPSCWTIEEETGRHRFIKHDDIGSKLVVPILKHLKFSKKQIEYIKKLIKYHIYPSSLICSEDANDKAYMKFYRKMDDCTIDIIILAMADRLSARGSKVTEEMISKNIEGLKLLLNRYLSMANEIKPIEKLLDGTDIMEILHIKQGKELGEIIKSLKEAQLSGEVNNRDEAVEFIKKLSE